MRYLPATLVLFSLAPSALFAQNHVITFEEPGLVAMANSPGALVPAASRLADQFLATLGISFRAPGGFVAIVNHGAATPSVPNIIGSTTTSGQLNYSQAITIRFFDPTNPTLPAVTDFFRVRGDLTPLNSGTVTLNAFAVDDAPLGTVVVPDAPPGAVVTFSATIPGMHRVVLTQTSATVGLDNVEFAPVRAAATYVPYGAGCAGSLGVPTLQSVLGALPALGGTLQVHVDHVPNGFAVMISGLSNTQSGAVSLPFDLSVLGMNGCQLYAEQLLLAGVPATGTAATWSLVIPALPTLAGQVFYNQAAVFDPTANAFGLVMSNAGAATLGG